MECLCLEENLCFTHYIRLFSSTQTFLTDTSVYVPVYCNYTCTCTGIRDRLFFATLIYVIKVEISNVKE